MQSSVGFRETTETLGDDIGLYKDLTTRMN